MDGGKRKAWHDRVREAGASQGQKGIAMIVAIVTTYGPDDGFKERFSSISSVCNAIIVADNTPGGHCFSELPPGFIVIQNKCNLGLAPALNIGVKKARELNASIVILFDQDSRPNADLVNNMAMSLRSALTVFGDRICIGPTHVDDGALKSGAAEPSCVGKSFKSKYSTVSCLPTSGLTVKLPAFAPEESFSDEFFLDLVDFEWCWRLRSCGWQFLRCNEIGMYHRLGISEKRVFGLTFHVPAPYRHYFQVRDTLRLISKNYVPFYSKVRLLAVLPLKALAYPLLLDRGIERLRWMALGLRDFLRGTRGMGAASSVLSRRK